MSKKARSHTAWTDEEKQFLKDHYPSRKTSEIAEFIQRTPNSIRRMATNLGLVKETINLPRFKDGLHHCNRCLEYKDPSEFYKNSSSNTGLYHFCKPCSSLRQKLDYHRTKVKKDIATKEAFIEANQNILFRCSVCNEMKDINNYSVYKNSKKPGEYTRRSRCTPCHTRMHRDNLLEKERNNEYAKFKG